MAKKNFSDITILVDMDDVIEELLIPWCDWLNKEHGLNVAPNSVVTWDITEYFPTLTKPQIYSPLNLEEFWDTSKPKEGAVEYLSKLIGEGFKVYICTSTNYQNIALKYMKVIRRHFPFIGWDKVIVAKDKHMIKGDFLVDDGVHNLQNGDYIKILVTAPHNKNYDAEGNGMIRADDWHTIYDTIVNMSQDMIDEKK